MLSISNHASVIASLGDHRTHIDLSLSLVNGKFELVSTMFTKGIELELARKLAADEDDAIDIATDLEWEAQDEMAAMDIDFTKTSGWPEALDLHFAQSRNAAAA